MNTDEDIQRERRKIESQVRQKTCDEIDILNGKYQGQHFQFEFKGEIKEGTFAIAKLADSSMPINYEIYLLVSPEIIANGVCSIFDSRGQKLSAMIETKTGPKENGVKIFATCR
jgi:hypothetical protein